MLNTSAQHCNFSSVLLQCNKYKEKIRLFKLQERITEYHDQSTGTIIIKQEKALLIEGPKNSRRLKGYGTAALSMSGSAPYLDGNLLKLF